MIVRLIQKMEQDGSLKRLMRAGFMSTKVVDYKRIWERYSSKVQGGQASTQAVLDTAIESKCSEVKVWRAINSMKQE